MDSSSGFRDTSTECAICLSPLDNNEETIELTCGHKWHLVCLKEQLEHAQPSHSQRLLFSGCRCAKCGLFCNHPALQHLTRKTDSLRAKVHDLIQSKLKEEYGESLDSEQKAAYEEEAWRSFAFYLCSACHEPYFGGTMDCADNLAVQEEEEATGLCESCSEQTQSHCSHPAQHRGYHVWKCRYCCRPANHICYGTVHFCQSCHDRNSERVRQRHTFRSSEPKPLQPIPCPGGDQCPYPKPSGQVMHLNGPRAVCEQMYHCAWCLSNQHGGTEEEEQQPGSPNFITNPSGQHGMRGWKHMSPHKQWSIEQSEIPVNSTTSTNFVSSFDWCVMGYHVPLYRYVRDPSSVRIEASAKFLGRTDCPSVFAMAVTVLDRQRNKIHHESAGPFQAPVDFWERASITIESFAGAHELVLVVCGKDSRFWQGNFGSKVAECSVRVLCDNEDELENLLLPGVIERLQREPSEAPERPLLRGMGEVRRPPRVNNPLEAIEHPELQRWLIYDVVLPVCVLLLAWLLLRE